ncbi:THUMP domain-containing protein [Fischerella sp.]|jgi:tRNA(Ser,Leu) C12 N-acetylase TAN1|uniref:THUMP domain-containing protein n=1 Tax=Fischerella sp. TaxID=1191 RepID=UPI0025BF5126|nr:THUMP domain-containing protein [Fischerella sp.]
MMNDWNIIVSLHERGWYQAFKVLQEFGSISRSDFRNVLVMKVSHIDRFLETLREEIANDPNRFDFLARLVPVTCAFTFQSPQDFESRAQEAILQWVPHLAGKSFHVRMHRRGFKGKLSSPDEERFLDKVLLEALERAGTPGHITFENPDAIVVVETLGQRCGLSYWTREDLQRYSFLKVD